MFTLSCSSPSVWRARTLRGTHCTLRLLPAHTRTRVARRLPPCPGPMQPRPDLTRCQAPAPAGTASAPSGSAGTTWRQRRELAGPGTRDPGRVSGGRTWGRRPTARGLPTCHATTSGRPAQSRQVPAAPGPKSEPQADQAHPAAPPQQPPPPAWRSARPCPRNVARAGAGPGPGRWGGEAGRSGGEAARRRRERKGRGSPGGGALRGSMLCPSQPDALLGALRTPPGTEPRPPVAISSS